MLLLMAATKKTAKTASRIGRPPSHEIELRNERLLDTATQVFLEAGYAGAKMSVIAKRAGASMETLYLRYPNKAKLFAALIERKASEMLDIIGPLNPEREPREALTNYAIELISMMTKPDTQQLHRLVIAGSIDTPELGAVFWQAGPGRGFKIIRTYLQQQNDRGTLLIRDPDRAASLFMGMAVGGIALHATLGIKTAVQSVQQQLGWANYVVDIFLQSMKPN